MDAAGKLQRPLMRRNNLSKFTGSIAGSPYLSTVDVIERVESMFLEDAETIGIENIEVIIHTDDKFIRCEAVDIAWHSFGRLPRSKYIWQTAYKAALKWFLTGGSEDVCEAAKRAARAAFMNRKRFKKATARPVRQTSLRSADADIRNRSSATLQRTFRRR